MIRTVLATVAAVETTFVDATDGVNTSSMPQAAFNDCWWSSTVLYILSQQHVMTVQGWILDSLNLTLSTVF